MKFRCWSETRFFTRCCHYLFLGVVALEILRALPDFPRTLDFFLEKIEKNFPIKRKAIFLMNYSCSIANGSATQSERGQEEVRSCWWLHDGHKFVVAGPLMSDAENFLMFFSSVFDWGQAKRRKRFFISLDWVQAPFLVWLVCLCVHNCSALPLNYSMKSDPSRLFCCM